MKNLERRKEGGSTSRQTARCNFVSLLTLTTMTRIESISRSVRRTTEYGWLDIPQHAIDALARAVFARHPVTLQTLEHSTEVSCPQVAEIGPHYRLRLSGQREALADASADVDNAFLEFIRTHSSTAAVPAAR